MDRKEMSPAELGELLAIRLRQFRALEENEQKRLSQQAWEMVQQDISWPIILAAARAACAPPSEDEDRPAVFKNGEPLAGEIETPESGAPGLQSRQRWASRNEPWGGVEKGDLSAIPPPPVRHEVGRYERERLSASTRQAIRMGRQARRWHEIRKMRNVLLNIDQAYLKRMLGGESDALTGEINSLLRSWAPLVKERQGGGKPGRRRR